MINRLLTACALCLAVAATAARAASATSSAPFAPAADGKAQDVKPQDVILWQAFQAVEKTDQSIEVGLRMTTAASTGAAGAPGQDWKVYAKNLQFGAPPGLTIAGLVPPPAHKFIDPIEGKEVDVYDGGEFTLTLTGAPRWTSATLPLTVTYVGCTNTICLFPYTQTIDVAFIPAAASEPTFDPALTTANPGQDTAKVSQSTGDDEDLESRLAKKLNAAGVAFGTLLAIVFVGGLLSNLTPCVAPVLPITLRLLARQGGSPYANACAYAVGMVLCYSSLGLIAALSGGLFGSLLASTAFNAAFAVVMFGLGLTMLGFGDLSALQNLGTRLGSGKPSLFNTLLMGVGAGLVAAPCTGPILAALLAYTARSGSSVAASTALLGVYSCGFSLPYVLLGGAAGQITRLKVPPLLQLSVKLLFASVMFGLGLYYLRIPFYQLAQALRPHWRDIALAGLLAGALLSPVILLSKTLQNNKFLSIVPAALLGMGIFGSWQWMTTAGDGSEQAWFHTEDEAFAAAAQSGHPVLIDMWAEWCEACKKMDVTTMADPLVRAELANWTLLRLDMTESTPAIEALQQKYGVQSLPTLVLLPASAKVEHKAAIVGYISAPAFLGSLRQFTDHKAE